MQVTPVKFGIGFWIFMLVLTLAIVIAPLKFEGTMFADILLSIQKSFFDFVSYYSNALGIIVIFIVHQSQATSAKRLRATFFTVLATSIALILPIATLPFQSVLKSCGNIYAVGQSCGETLLQIALGVVPFVPLLLISENVLLAVKIAFLYGWFLLGMDLLRSWNDGGGDEPLVVNSLPNIAHRANSAGPQKAFGNRMF